MAVSVSKKTFSTGTDCAGEAVGMGILTQFLRIFAALLLSLGVAWAQEEEVEDTGPPAVDDEVFVQAVEVDGEQLFAVRGSTALPAEERAALVAKRVVEVAERSEATTVVMGIERGELGQTIFADGVMVSVTTQADADYEQMELPVLASLHAEAIEEAILRYRANRTDEAFSQSTLTALAWSAVFAFYCGILLWLRRRVPGWWPVSLSTAQGAFRKPRGILCRVRRCPTLPNS
ncbi:hypothetical protein [Shimia sp. MIT910701]|uniref:hypothetical protein n=1 Tax=Shimia sp. MIT910701 TaxID=3096987 RepID=UPI00399B6B8D